MMAFDPKPGDLVRLTRIDDDDPKLRYVEDFYWGLSPFTPEEWRKNYIYEILERANYERPVGMDWAPDPFTGEIRWQVRDDGNYRSPLWLDVQSGEFENVALVKGRSLYINKMMYRPHPDYHGEDLDQAAVQNNHEMQNVIAAALGELYVQGEVQSIDTIASVAAEAIKPPLMGWTRGAKKIRHRLVNKVGKQSRQIEDLAEVLDEARWDLERLKVGAGMLYSMFTQLDVSVMREEDRQVHALIVRSFEEMIGPEMVDEFIAKRDEIIDKVAEENDDRA